MKAVVFEDIGKISLKDVPDPSLQSSSDALVNITATSICGTDLHMIHGTLGEMKPGTILGHEGVGVIDAVGSGVRNLKEGDRVIIPSSIACGYCAYCRAGYFSQCDNANPNGARAGTAFFGGPKSSGSFSGLQAEKARIPFANVGPVKIPEWLSDDHALLLSDIFPTGFFGAEMAEIDEGDVVAVLGCGPVGLFAIASAFYFGAGRVIAVDRVPSRLEHARNIGAEIINFEEEDPVSVVLELTGGIGVDRLIDAVGVDAEHPHQGFAEPSKEEKERFQNEVEEITHHAQLSEKWKPGDAPSQALQWALQMLDKAGTLSIIGVYPENATVFPIGKAMNRNLTINMGNCNHRKYIPLLLDLVGESYFDFSNILTKVQPFSHVIDAYRAFDLKHEGWIKVKLET